MKHIPNTKQPAVSRKYYLRVLLLLICMTVVLGLVSLCSGRYHVEPANVLKILLSKLLPINVTWDETMVNVILNLRLPRMVAALLVGASLSIAGATYQGVFKNPLVSGDLLGITFGSCVGAAGAILLGLGSIGVQIMAFLGGMAAILLTTSLPKMFRNDSTMLLVLSGIIISGLMRSLLGLLKYVADPETQLPAITFWEMGSLADIKMLNLAPVIPAMIISIVVLVGLRWQINLLSLGDYEARSLGVNIKLVRGLAVLCSTILIGCATCLAGNIVWVGLIIPHLARILVGPDNTRVLPATIFIGGSFMIVIDTIARSIVATEVPLSILTGIIGTPIFIWLIYRQRMKL